MQAKVWVSPSVRHVDGKTIRVDGYWRSAGEAGPNEYTPSVERLRTLRGSRRKNVKDRTDPVQIAGYQHSWDGNYEDARIGLMMTPQEIEEAGPFDSRIKVALAERTLAKAIAGAPATSPTLYRGANIPRGQIDSLKVGSTIDLPTVSFSARAYYVRGYDDEEMGQGPYPVIYEVAPKAKAVRLAGISQFPEEYEWVSQGRFRVTKITPPHGRVGAYHIRLEQEAVFDVH